MKGLEQRPGIFDRDVLVVAAAHLEVQVRPPAGAGAAEVAELLAGADTLPDMDQRAAQHVEVVVGAVGLAAIDRGVVAAAALVAAALIGECGIFSSGITGPPSDGTGSEA